MAIRSELIVRPRARLDDLAGKLRPADEPRPARNARRDPGASGSHTSADEEAGPYPGSARCLRARPVGWLGSPLLRQKAARVPASNRQEFGHFSPAARKDLGAAGVEPAAAGGIRGLKSRYGPI